MTEQKKQGLECLEPPPQTFLMEESTDYEILYAKVKRLWDEYVALAEAYKQEAPRTAIAHVYSGKSDAFYQAIIMLREMLDE